MLISLVNDLKPGEAKPLAQYQNKKFLLNNGISYKIGSNVCPHQSSRIISKTTDHIVCQYHGWSWDTNGNPTGAGYTKLCNNQSLPMVDTYQHQGLIFNKQIELPELPISFENFELMEHRVDRVKVDNPAHLMNVFLDVDHIPVVHDKVYEEMGIFGEPDVKWDYFKNGSMQKVYHSKDPEKPLIFVWLAIYPYTMIEWQQGSLFITDCFNTQDGVTEVAVYKYQEYFSENYQKNEAAWETAWKQDKNQAEQIVEINSKMFEEQKLHYLRWINLNSPRYQK